MASSVTMTVPIRAFENLTVPPPVGASFTRDPFVLITENRRSFCLGVSYLYERCSGGGILIEQATGSSGKEFKKKWRGDIRSLKITLGCFSGVSAALWN